MRPSDFRNAFCLSFNPSAKLPDIMAWVPILLLVGWLPMGPACQKVLWAENLPSVEEPAGQQSDAPMTDIHDIKPALPMEPDLQWLIWLVVAVVFVAVLAAGAWWLWRRRKNKNEEAQAAPLPAPEVEAYALLDCLAAEDHSNLKGFYFRLSAILRRYMERRYGIPAAEMTTEELLPAMRGLALSQDLSQEVRSFCLRSDPIKFAGARGDAGRVAHELALVRDFVRQTTLPPVGDEAAPNAAAQSGEGPGSFPESGKTGRQDLKQIPGIDHT